MPRKPRHEPMTNTNVVLDRLERAIRWSEEFSLLFVKCNHYSQREWMRRALLERLPDIQVLEIVLEDPIISLLDEITAHWNATNPPHAICVYGLEISISEQREASPVLGRLNHDRDLLRRAIPVPLLIWLPDFALDCLARGAPDFWAWRSGVYEFPTDNLLWQAESRGALRLRNSALASLAYEDKQKEITRLEGLLRTAQDLPSEDERGQEILARLLMQLAQLHLELGNLDQAEAHYKQGMDVLQRLGDKRGMATALISLARIQYEQDNMDEAVRLLTESLRLARESGDRRMVMIGLSALAMAHYEQGDLAQTAQLLEEGLQLSEDLGDPHRSIVILGDSAKLLYKIGDVDGSMRAAREGLQLAKRSSDKPAIARMMDVMATIQEEQGNLAEAARLWEQGLRIFGELGDRYEVAQLLPNLARVHRKQGNFGEALRCYEESLKIGRTLGDKRGTAENLLLMGGLWQEQGKDYEALQNYASAWSLLRQLRSPLTSLALTGMKMIRAKVGDEQFQAWLKKYSVEETSELFRELDAAP
jgi:tetratricopeptide (TPR) repeat protein